MQLTHSVGQVLPTIWEYNIFKANDSTVSFPVKVPMNPILWRRQDGTLTAGSGKRVGCCSRGYNPRNHETMGIVEAAGCPKAK